MGLNLTASRFAHLLGPLARPLAAARADDKDDDKKDDDGRADDDDDKDRKDDDKDRKGRKSKRSKKARAEDDDDEARAEDEGNDEASAADDDEGDDDRKDDARKAQHARLAERARGAQIFRCSAAGARPDVAAHLAFETDMRGPDAVNLLTAIASGDGTRLSRGDTLRSRMAGVSLPALGSDGGTAEDRDGPQAAASMILAAARRARGEA
ncbi:hypothetical protein OKW38_005157 [Paraburkholderia sp. MM5496-R1]|uniref:hypothetical protein n=1 Tax=Paraburkholderia sp. MM5496-R1 TaxID=2991065 RepID=UPI003D207802